MIGEFGIYYGTKNERFLRSFKRIVWWWFFCGLYQGRDFESDQPQCDCTKHYSGLPGRILYVHRVSWSNQGARDTKTYRFSLGYGYVTFVGDKN